MNDWPSRLHADFEKSGDRLLWQAKLSKNTANNAKKASIVE